MLQNYEANLRNHNGSYIPERVDNFLCSKLQTSQSTEEVTAIVDFYAFKAGGREGRVIYLLPAQTKKRIISLLLERLDNYDERKSHSALILVEVLRRGEYLYKAYFSPVRSASYNYENWWPKVGLPEAKMRFRRWWNSSSSWQQKEMHDPLKDSNLQIVSP